MPKSIVPCSEREEEILMEGMRIGKTHVTPSPTTIKFMNKIEQLMAKFETRLDNIDEALKKVPTKAEMREANLSLMKEFSKEIENKYVSRERFNPVEKICYGLVGASLLALLYGIFKFVIK